MLPMIDTSSNDHPDTQPRHEMHGLYPKAESVADFQRHLAAVHARIETENGRVNSTTAPR